MDKIKFRLKNFGGVRGGKVMLLFSVTDGREIRCAMCTVPNSKIEDASVNRFLKNGTNRKFCKKNLSYSASRGAVTLSTFLKENDNFEKTDFKNAVSTWGLPESVLAKNPVSQWGLPEFLIFFFKKIILYFFILEKH